MEIRIGIAIRQVQNGLVVSVGDPSGRGLCGTEFIAETPEGAIQIAADEVKAEVRAEFKKQARSAE